MKENTFLYFCNCLNFLNVCFFFFVYLAQTRVIWEEVLPPSYWPLEIFLINYWCGRIQPTMGFTSPEQVFLCWLIKHAKYEPENNSVSSVPSWLLFQFLPIGSCLKFFLWLLSMRGYKLFVSMVFITAAGKKKKKTKRLCLFPVASIFLQL